MANDQQRRRSKWDTPSSNASLSSLQHQQQMQLADNQSGSSLEAASVAAAKINAMLISKGKLKLPTAVTSKTKTNANQQKKEDQIVAEVEINDVPIHCRNLLTRGCTQDDISKMTGVAVSTRGRYMSFADRAKNNMGERPLYLCVQGQDKEAVDRAVMSIREIIADNMQPSKGRGRSRLGPSRFEPVPVRPGLSGPGGVSQGNRQVPPPLMTFTPPRVPSQPVHMIQEKIFIGLDHAHPSYSVKEKILGPGGSFLMHIRTETGVNVTLRGKGSGTPDPISGREAFEPMYIHLSHPKIESIEAAKKLCDNLIQTVHGEYSRLQSQIISPPIRVQPVVSPSGVVNLQTVQMPTVQSVQTIQQQQIQMPSVGQHVQLAQATAQQQATLTAAMAQPQVPQMQQLVPQMPQAPRQIRVQVSTATVRIPSSNPRTQTVIAATTLAQATQLAQQPLSLSSVLVQPPQLTQAIQPGPGQMVQLQHMPHPGQVPTQVSVQPPQLAQSQQIVTTHIPVSVAAVVNAPGALHSVVQHPMNQAPRPRLIQHQQQPPQPVVAHMPQLSVYLPPKELQTVQQQQQQPLPQQQQPPPPQKRQFKEDPDKLEDGLLGYQHGPPHLTNLGASSPPRTLSHPNQPVHSSHGLTPGIISHSPRLAHPDDARLMPPPAPVPVGLPPNIAHDRDLMPPPALPASGKSRVCIHEDAPGGANKRMRLVDYAGDSDEDDEGNRMQHNLGMYNHLQAKLPYPSNPQSLPYPPSSQPIHLPPGTTGTGTYGGVIHRQAPVVYTRATPQYSQPPPASYSQQPPQMAPSPMSQLPGHPYWNPTPP
ncbi:KH homology domain-containing protein 4-like isoform X2 [Anneissia japonica]|uniref:KH homology domain-containing protein 4-like isoform X2 n=1 Tax=Anneissia japonica TaxID=1529436 RepID=UPI001425B316|nr:KH homology domain-containing protein 4-like isoform X2 [Anneissia japonica]